MVVDRLIVSNQTDQTRLADSVETALRLANGVVLINIPDVEDRIFSENFACDICNISFGEIEPRTFSFNNPHGACSTCTGLGNKLEVDPVLVVPDSAISIAAGAVQPWARSGTMSPWYSCL